MKQTIILNNKTYTYNITYKNIKNIRVRVIDGQIQVSAPRGIFISQIEQLILQNKDQIIKWINDYEPYITKDCVYLFGKKYSIVYQKCDKCIVVGDKIYCTDLNQLDNHLFLELYSFLLHRVTYYIDNDFHRPMPRIFIKHYKSKWGSCYWEKNILYFNSALVHLDYKYVEYIIVHELCHFLQHNHSKLFYQEVEKRLPNYKELIKGMKGKHT